jgi:hypothetical protein
MNWRFRVQAPQIAERLRLEPLSENLDVGGCYGTVLAAILHAWPAGTACRGSRTGRSASPFRGGS